MKSPVSRQFLLLAAFFSWACMPNLYGQVVEYPYLQGFEESFRLGEEVVFQFSWWGNEVRDDGSRIYQAGAREAHSGNGALALLPTASFSGEVKFHFDASQIESAEVRFWSRSGKNGNGTRPSILLIAFSADSGRTFMVEQPLSSSFPNDDTPYQQHKFALPDEVAGKQNAVIRITVSRTEEGQGTAACVFLDDFEINGNSKAFSLLAASVLSRGEVELRFNRELDEASAVHRRHYRLDKGIALENVIFGPDKKRVLLRVSTLMPGISYSGVVEGLEDSRGNMLERQEFNFFFEEEYELQTHDLLISEIHAAPNVGTLLPEVEWVEIFNASGRSVSLKDVQFADESRRSALPDYQLNAGEYVLLCAAADVPSMASYGKVLGLTPWPSLNNSGDQLSIFSPEGRLLDKVEYTQGLYNSTEKSKGGWSLERIDMSRPCLGAVNWSASIATSGGTPGQENSIARLQPDLLGPQLQMAYAIDSLTIQLLFNEDLDTTQLSSGNFQISPVLNIKEVKPHPFRAERLSMIVQTPLNPEVDYSVEIEHIQDCSGNRIAKGSSQSRILFPVQATPGNVKINEVMYDPLTNSEEWIEIANTTEKTINLRNWQLATYEQEVKSVAVLSRDDLLLLPESFLVFSREVSGVQSAFPTLPLERVVEIETLFQLPNAGDSIALINEKGEVQDLMGYADEMHSPFRSVTKGVSLERINLNASSRELKNWISASESSNNGTPALANSNRFRAETFAEEQLVVEPEVIVPEGNGLASFATIVFKSRHTGLQLSLRVFDAHGRVVRQLAKGQSLGADTFFTWNGTDEDEKIVRTGYYIILLQVYNEAGYSKEFKKVLVVGDI